jgi:hypothetical protein
MTAAPRQLTTDSAIRRRCAAGWLLLAIALRGGVTLEALHGFKVQAYLASEMRREMWRPRARARDAAGHPLLWCRAAARRSARAAQSAPRVLAMVRWAPC